ncbi:hypothetical protein FB45DRAFT_932823 [Roridomyces roridus]|uniref:DUF6534 domain-containing protein n=1 Tax=Roridomyces roridus TaxID=1738132 RepID=A0AAD7FFU8_9AGAR|nr:hypothetical protein FB45DRAFT_932823 [Roridomyces roridus]
MIPYGVDAPAILGVMEVGVFFSLVMFGVVALQGYVYFQHCHADRTGLKLLVGSVLFLEVFHSIASCQAIYYFTIVLAGVPELEKPANSYALSITPVFETLITALVQGFFAYRIRVLSGRTYLSAFCWGLGLLRFIGGMGVAVEAFLDVAREPDYFVLQDTYGWLITCALNIGAVLDVVICIAMCKYLKRMYSAYNFPRSDKLIDRLVSWTIQTGLITSMTSVAVVISFQTMKHNFVWLALYTFLAKLYTNSLLVSLNSRPAHREIVRAPSPTPKAFQWDSPGSSRPGSPAFGHSRPGTPHFNPQITIEIMQTTTVDSSTALIPTAPRYTGGGLRVPEQAVYNLNPSAAFMSV